MCGRQQDYPHRRRSLARVKHKTGGEKSKTARCCPRACSFVGIAVDQAAAVACFRRRQAAEAAGTGDQARMVTEFQAVLAEVPPGTAERLRLLDEFAAVLHEAQVMMHDWNHTLNAAEAGGEGPGPRR
jgi:hypothetical protein